MASRGASLFAKSAHHYSAYKRGANNYVMLESYLLHDNLLAPPKTGKRVAIKLSWLWMNTSHFFVGIVSFVSVSFDCCHNFNQHTTGLLWLETVRLARIALAQRLQVVQFLLQRMAGHNQPNAVIPKAGIDQIALDTM